MRHRICLFTTILASAAIAGPAFAQAQTGAEAGADAADDGVIVVTAQKREQNLQDTPLSIAAFSGDSLADRGVSNLKNITNFVPNVVFGNTARSNAGGSAYGAFIRGVGNGEYTFPTDPGVGVYVDGVYMARTMGGLMSIADVERIEVLRGPQGTLYGKNTLGGAVNVITAAPRLSGSAEGSLMVRFGSYGRRDVISMINAPLVEDRVGLKLSASYFHSNGWGRQTLTGQRLGDESRLVLTGGLKVALSDTLTLDIRGDYSSQRNTGLVQQVLGSNGLTTIANVNRYNQIAAPVVNARYGLPAGSVFDGGWTPAGENETWGTSEQRDDYDIGGGSAILTWEPSDTVEIKSITAYRKLDTDVWNDGDATPYVINYAQEQIDHKQFSQELQIGGTAFDDRLTYLLGAYFIDESGTSSRLSQAFHGVYQITGLASDARDTLNLQDYKSRSYALFTQQEFNIGGGLSVIAGARFNWDEKTYGFEALKPERNNEVLTPLSRQTSKWNSFTPKLGVNWKATDDILLFGSFSRGFKSGGFANPTATTGVLPYGPEKLTAFEAGIKSQWLDRRLTFNLTGFTQEWSDIQLTSRQTGPTGAIINVVANGGTARLKGFEAEFVAKPVDAVQLNLGVGYTDARFTGLTPGVLLSGLTLATKLPRVPKWMVSAGGQIEQDTGIGNIKLRADLSYRSSQFLNLNDPTSVQKAYTLVSARVALKPKGLDMLELAVEGSNLFNSRYDVVRINAAPIWPIVFNALGDPRMVNVTAKVSF